MRLSNRALSEQTDGGGQSTADRALLEQQAEKVEDMHPFNKLLTPLHLTSVYPSTAGTIGCAEEAGTSSCRARGSSTTADAHAGGARQGAGGGEC
jgi:hypothetical protein